MLDLMLDFGFVFRFVERFATLERNISHHWQTGMQADSRLAGGRTVRTEHTAQKWQHKMAFSMLPFLLECVHGDVGAWHCLPRIWGSVCWCGLG